MGSRGSVGVVLCSVRVLMSDSVLDFSDSRVAGVCEGRVPTGTLGEETGADGAVGSVEESVEESAEESVGEPAVGDAAGPADSRVEPAEVLSSASRRELVPLSVRVTSASMPLVALVPLVALMPLVVLMPLVAPAERGVPPASDPPVKR
jgi:hypothetical protein